LTRKKRRDLTYDDVMKFRTFEARPTRPGSRRRWPRTPDHSARGLDGRSLLRGGSGHECRLHRRQRRSQWSCWTSLRLPLAPDGQHAAVGSGGQDSDGCLSYGLL
jgi:hypothetical protein